MLLDKQKLSQTFQADCLQLIRLRFRAMTIRNILGGTVVLLSVVLPYTSNSQQSFRSGTTMVLLANQRSAVLASDSFEHASNAGLTATFTRKVDKIGENLLLGMSGIGASSDGNGTTVVDLQKSLPTIVGALSWSEVEADAKKMHEAIVNQLRPLTQILFEGPPDQSLNPQVTVLLAGLSPREKIFAMRFRYPGTYVRQGTNHRVTFSPGSWEMLPIRQGNLITLILTRLENVEREARDVLAGRIDTMLRYPSIRRLHEPNVDVDEKILRAAAEEIVKFTMERDSHIGGAIQVVSLSLDKAHDIRANPPNRKESRR